MHIQKAELSLANGDFAGAKKILRSLLQRDKLNKNVLYLLSITEAQLNNFEEAINILSRLLAVDPQHPGAHYTKANLLSRTNRHAEALVHHDRAAKYLSSNPWVFINRGNSHAALKNYTMAIADFSKAIELDPSHSVAFGNKGNALLELKSFEDSIENFNKAIELDSGNADAYSGKSACLTQLKRSEEALLNAERAIQLRPDHAEAWCNRGVALNDLQRQEEALASNDRAIQIKPAYAEAWLNRGVALNELRRHEEALASYDQTLKLKPEHAEAWLNRGVVLNNLRRYEEALANYERAIELKADYAEAWINRGHTLRKLRRHAEALGSYDHAVKAKPADPEAWLSQGVALADIRLHKEALISYNRCIELKPNCAEAFFNKGILQLSQKNFNSGFENYEYRWKIKKFSSQPLKTDLPPYNRNSHSKNILLWAEQGLGDEVFYAGLLSAAEEHFSNISLVADVRLHSILNRSFPKISLIHKEAALAPEYVANMDCHAPIGSLGYMLRLDSEMIKESRRPFLIPDQRRSDAFKSNIPFSSGKIICGIAWNSKNKDFGDEKSIFLRQLEPILKNPQLEFVNLQYGEVDSEIQEIRNRLGICIHQVNGLDIYSDIDGLLALINACDLVITTSNVTAHLAGSIGKKGYILVPYSNGRIWYWHLDDDHSFWYPNLSVFYQGDSCNWTDTILQMQKSIEEAILWNQ